MLALALAWPVLAFCIAVLIQYICPDETGREN
jgi:hypothetical protein